MKILISGLCGFAGSTLATELIKYHEGLQILGFDNFIRPGSETNRQRLRDLGIKVFHADLRNAEDIETLPKADWVIDAAANPSVLAGLDGQASSRQLANHNLGGTVNLLEYCRRHTAGFVLLSTSRVYSIAALASAQMKVTNKAFAPNPTYRMPAGLSEAGVDETFSTMAPISLYGATKLASETMALEYGATFNFPVWINRCGVLAGAGQFGRADQGIFSFWLHSWLGRLPLKYIGFDGQGHQTRDALHPKDLVSLLSKQMAAEEGSSKPKILNIGGGDANSMSLAQLSDWCEQRSGKHTVASDPTPRAFDIPWMVMNSSLARETWGWHPATTLHGILDEIATHAEKHPEWLDLVAS